MTQSAYQVTLKTNNLKESTLDTSLFGTLIEFSFKIFGLFIWIAKNNDRLPQFAKNNSWLQLRFWKGNVESIIQYKINNK